ncbi:MAG: DUF5808 domain-containing protein [Bacteroidota bacterium]
MVGLFYFLYDAKRDVTLSEVNDDFDPYNDPIHDSSNYWLNTFYYNPKDKRLLPPKRVAAMGWTINFGNPNAILLIAVFIVTLFLV